MRRFSRGLLVFAGLLVQSPGTSAGLNTSEPALERQRDPRLLHLQRFFRRYSAPIYHLAEEFLIAADRHRLDWRLLPSIAIIESSGGRYARNNNVFGWGSARLGFPSVKDGIHTVALKLATSKLYRNKPVDGILETYNSRPGYADKVKRVMGSLGPQIPLVLASD